MTDIKQRFEELFLDGRDRSNVLVSSQLHLGADGEYFNPNTRALFKFYRLGWEDACANVAEDLSAGDALPVHAPEPKTPSPWIYQNCPGCKGKGDGNGNECPRCWEIPF